MLRWVCLQSSGFGDFGRRAVEEKVGEIWVWKALNAKLRGLGWILLVLETGSQDSGPQG